MKFKFPSIFFKTILVSIFSIFLIYVEPKPAHADFSNLTPCKDSKAFQKRLTTSIKKLENRLKLYVPDSKEAQFLVKEIELTKTRFTKYENSSLLCGKEGLPRIIATGQWDHVKELCTHLTFFFCNDDELFLICKRYINNKNQI